MVTLSSFSERLLLCLGLTALGLTAASPILARAPTDYAPLPATCPPQSTKLVRQADGISLDESTYVSKRYATASKSLDSWLKKIDPSFDASKAPMIALTSSGGGYRAMLAGAGVVKAFDGRETDSGSAVSGLYDAFTYHAGLSGGSWLVSSIAGNDYATVSSLQAKLWESSLNDNLLNDLTAQPIPAAAAPVYSAVQAQVAAKQAAGFEQTLVDPWSRLLSYGLLDGPEGKIQMTLSDIASGARFSARKAPYPVMTALGSNNFEGICIPQPNATQYEIHPFEFGSWDKGVDAFVSSKYLGTNFSNGAPTGGCTVKFENLGFMFGISSNIFGSACSPIPANSHSSLPEALAALTAPNQSSVPESAVFAPIPNPFQHFPPSSLIAGQSTLQLVDGGVGEAVQGNAIWPFINRPSVNVIIVNDNSADTSTNFPNGIEIFHTYNAAKAAGLTRMPVIPAADVFESQGLNQKPVFFGCHSPDTVTIIWIPNFNYTFPSGLSTYKLQYSVSETRGMISNGVAVANYGGEKGWPLCLACGIMAKNGNSSMPAGCAQCLQRYCFN